MYVLRVLQFLLPLFIAISSEQNVQQVRGSYYSEYPELSSSNGFLLDYLRSYIGQGSPSRYNDRPHFHNGYDTLPNFQGGYETGPHFKGGHDTEPHAELKSNPHLKTDVTRLCDTVTCGNGTCSVIIKDEYSYPVTICAKDIGDPVVPRDVHAVCRKKGLTSAVLTGDPNAFRPLRPFSCLGCEDCPYGTTCINNACCYGTANCNGTTIKFNTVVGSVLPWFLSSGLLKAHNFVPTFALCPYPQGYGLLVKNTLKTLFEKSFEFNGNTYTLSRLLVQNDRHASAICVAQGGYLVEVETREENNAIQNFLRDCDVPDSVLIAGNDEEEDGVFLFQYSGATLGFFDWRVGQPGGGTSENCIVMDPRDDWLWNDRDCLDERFRFMCEFPEPPEIIKKKGYH